MGRCIKSLKTTAQDDRGRELFL